MADLHTIFSSARISIDLESYFYMKIRLEYAENVATKCDIAYKDFKPT